MQGVECKQMVWERKKRVKWEFRKPEQASSFSSSNCSLYLFHKKKKKKSRNEDQWGKSHWQKIIVEMLEKAGSCLEKAQKEGRPRVGVMKKRWC